MEDIPPLLSLKQTATKDTFLLDKSCTTLENGKRKIITQSFAPPHLRTSEHLFVSFFFRHNFFLHWVFKSEVNNANGDF